MKAIETPFTEGVPAVFIHVRNLEKSANWYNNLLGKAKQDNIRSDIHIIELENGANIFLVQTDKPKPTEQVLCSLPAPDLIKTRAFFELNGIEYIQFDEEVIHFKDLDGNVLMACSI